MFGMDSRDLPPGKTIYDKNIYNRVAMMSVPRGSAIQDVNDDFYISGGTLGWVADDCPIDKRRILYRSTGAHQDAYSCSKDGQPTEVRLSTNVARKGSRWTMSGRAEVTGDWLGGYGTLIYNERIILDLTNNGCKLISYNNRQDDRRPGKAGQIMRSTPGAKCFMIQ